MHSAITKSFWIGRFSGINVYMHWTFLVLLAAVGMSRGYEGLSILFAVFASVLLHEFGHSLVAQRYGIPVHGIVLLPIGGVAGLDDIPKNREFMITIAGPAVNVVLAVGAYYLGFQQFMIWNIVLATFNLIPVFPMDGGRLFRAVLARFMSYSLATYLAARSGQVAAILFGGLFLWAGNLLMATIFVFIFMAAQAELTLVRMMEHADALPLASEHRDADAPKGIGEF